MQLDLSHFTLSPTRAACISQLPSQLAILQYVGNNEAAFCRLKDLLRVDDSVDNDRDCLCEQSSVNSIPNKEASVDHTHWMSGDETDSDWVISPVKCHDNRTIPTSLPGIVMRQCAGTKRSLFTSDDSSQEQLIKRSLGKLSFIVYEQT